MNYRPSTWKLKNVDEGIGDALREAWERDVTERKEFFEDQLKNSTLICIIILSHHS